MVLLIKLRLIQTNIRNYPNLKHTFQLENTRVSGSAVAAVTAYAEGGTGVAVHPAFDQIRFPDERSGHGEIFDAGLVEQGIHRLDAAMTAHQDDGGIHDLFQRFSILPETGLVLPGLDTGDGSAVGADFDGIDSAF